MQNDIIKELGTNFIEYAVAVNTDRAIPDATTGLKPVAKRILYCAYDEGYSYSKPHVKCANIVGNVMAYWHPHGDSSIYGALVRLSQSWVMRYPLIDFHGSNGNRDGDGPAAYRYTEARLAKLAEDGMLWGMKKNVVDYIPNYSETKDEPITLPSLFPNLLCNPNTGIGVAVACNWAPHNLREVANAIISYMNGEEPILPGPDFPTGGVIINKNDIPNIMKTGHGSVKIRGKYNMEDNNIVFTEIPYGVATENLIESIGKLCDDGTISGIADIRNESNRKKGFRLVLECGKDANIKKIINQLFKETDLQTSFSYNQVALINKTPTELNLKDCCKIYVEHNIDCIGKEINFDLQKIRDRLNIVEGLLKALANIDDIIEIIKKSESASKAGAKLQEIYHFNDEQVKAIINMKLGKLAGLERIEIENEKAELLQQEKNLQTILQDLPSELKQRLEALVKKYGDDRRTELAQIEEPKGEDKEIAAVIPEKCVVVMTENGNIKRVPTTSFRTQRRNGKGVKTQDDITSVVIRTNTIDNLMVFSTTGKMYRLLVDDIPVGTNATKGVPIKSLIEMEPTEYPATIYSIYRDTDAKFVLFITKGGMVKKTSLEEYLKTKKKSGIGAIILKDGDSLAAVTLVKEENIILVTEKGMVINFSSLDVGASSRMTQGVKGINLVEGDKVIAALPIRDSKDALAVFSQSGHGKRISQEELVIQKRGGKGIICYKNDDGLAGAAMVSDDDNILIVGNSTSICILASDIPTMGRTAIGNKMLKSNRILSVSKV